MLRIGVYYIFSLLYSRVNIPHLFNYSVAGIWILPNFWLFRNSAAVNFVVQGLG